MAHGDKPTVEAVLLAKWPTAMLACGSEVPMRPTHDDWALEGPVTSFPITSWRRLNSGVLTEGKIVRVSGSVEYLPPGRP